MPTRQLALGRRPQVEGPPDSDLLPKKAILEKNCSKTSPLLIFKLRFGDGLDGHNFTSSHALFTFRILLDPLGEGASSSMPRLVHRTEAT